MKQFGVLECCDLCGNDVGIFDVVFTGSQFLCRRCRGLDAGRGLSEGIFSRSPVADFAKKVADQTSNSRAKESQNE